MACASPGLLIGSLCYQLVMLIPQEVRDSSSEGLLQRIFESLPWCTSDMVASGQFSVQHHLWKAVAPPALQCGLADVALSEDTWPQHW